MEEEHGRLNIPNHTQSHLNIRELLVATYRGRTPADTHEAQHQLVKRFQTPGFTQQLVCLILGQEELQIKKAAASLLKNYSYDLAHSGLEKASFIELLYGLTMEVGIDTRIKELLGGGLEHLFNRDEEGVYKNVVKEKVLEVLAEESFERYDACIIVIQAHFNSLLQDPDLVLDYFCQILQPLAAKALKLYQAITSFTLEEWLVRDRTIMPTVTLLFQFLQSAFEKMVEEEDYYREDMRIIRKNEFLVGMLESYLLLFHNNHSIVSRCYPQANPVKATITSIVAELYGDDFCPEKMFQIVFLTALAECKNVVEEPEIERVLVQCLTVLQNHLARNSFSHLFQEHKLQMVFALFMYSASTQQQRDSITDDPQLFVQLAEEYTEGSARSTYLKVRAACLLKVIAEKIDEAPRNILEILMVIMSGSVGSSEQDSELMQCVKNQFSRFDFYGLSAEQKLETSLMVLAAISPYINIREDMFKVVYAFFLTQFDSLVRIESPLVILRIIRSIAYFPSAIYFLYIETQMNRGQVFILEGIKAFERILRSKKTYPEIHKFLASILTNLLKVVRMEDPVMELIVINNYDSLLKPNPELYRAVLKKIKESFLESMATNQHAALISFNLLYALLRIEKDATTLAHIQKEFYEISQFLQGDNQQQLYSRYEEKLIEIYQLLLERGYTISAEVERFAVQSLRYLARQEKGTQIFRFYNAYLVKLDGAIFRLEGYFRAFWEEVQRRYHQFLNANESIEALPYYCFLMSEIIANHCQISLTETDLLLLIDIADKVGADDKQYPLLVLLTLLYTQPYPVVNFLKSHNMYEQFLSGITKVAFSGSLPRKVFNLAYIMLLEIEDSPTYIRQILLQCIHNLRQLNQRTRNRLQHLRPTEVRQRRSVEERAGVEVVEEAMQDDNQLVNLFVKFRHPFEALSEFDQFKVKFWMNDHLMSDIDADLKADLRSIMETELVDRTKLRIIRKVKRQ